MEFRSVISRRHFLMGALLAAPLATCNELRNPCVLTEDNIEGPYYKEGSPWRTTLFSNPDEPGERVIISGSVSEAGIDKCIPLSGAVVDIWQANKDGCYSFGANATPPDYNFRGKIQTDQEGKFRFLTIVPGNYVQTGDTWPRARHVHFIVTHPGFQSLTTQGFFSIDQEHNYKDQYFKRSQLIKLTNSDDSSATYKGIFNFALERLG